MITLYAPIGDNVTIDTEINGNLNKLCVLLDYDIVSVINFNKENRIATSKKIFLKKDNKYIQLNKKWAKVINSSETDILSLVIEKKQILFYENSNEGSTNYLPLIDNAKREIYIPIFLDSKNSKDSGKDLIGCVYVSTFDINNVIEINEITQGKIHDLIYNLTRLYESLYLVHQKKESIFNLINMMSEITKEKEPYMVLHPYHVAQLSKEIGKSLNLTEEVLEKIYFSGLLHDIGKVYLDRSILNKESPLTEDEYTYLKSHSVYGSNIVKSVTGLEEISSIVKHHHERYDGKGYPDGLKHEEIPLESRIICVADAVDAMISHRSYRDPLSIDSVFTELIKNKEKQFDPTIVDIMINILTTTKEEISNIMTDSIVWSTLTIATSKKIYSIEGTLRRHSLGCFFKTEKFNFGVDIKKTDITNVSLYINRNNNEILQYKVKLDYVKENEAYISNFKSISTKDSFNILWDLDGEFYLSNYRTCTVKISKIGGNTLMFSLSKNQLDRSIEDTLLNLKIFFGDLKNVIVSGKITNSFNVGNNFYYQFTYVNIKANVKDEIFKQIFKRQIEIKHIINRAL